MPTFQKRKKIGNKEIELICVPSIWIFCVSFYNNYNFECAIDFGYFLAWESALFLSSPESHFSIALSAWIYKNKWISFNNWHFYSAQKTRTLKMTNTISRCRQMLISQHNTIQCMCVSPNWSKYRIQLRLPFFLSTINQMNFIIIASLFVYCSWVHVKELFYCRVQ